MLHDLRSRAIVLAGALACCSLSWCVAAESADVETDPLVLKKLETFQDWKFGLFMHWGIYSQWGCIESWPLIEEDKWARPDDLPAWTERGKDMKRFSADYRKLNQTFNPRHFDPQSWVDAARQAGMKYVMFTTKHHDGFCMFDTQQTDFRTTAPACPFHANPRADVVKSVFDAFRKAGFGIGAYYSKSDWHQPGYWDPARPHPTRNPNYDTAKEPDRWATFVKFSYKVIEELVSHYGPFDILWLDGGQVRPPQQDINMPAIAAMARKHQPGLIIVDRTVGGRYENYRTPEQEVPPKALPFVWETCMTMGDQWSYKPHDNYKSPRQLIHLLVDIVAKGGNFLLNIGPDPDGQLPGPAVERLAAMGQWIKVNGEAIYGTRAVAPYKVGRTCLTKKGSTIYLIYLADKDESAPPAKLSLPAITDGQTVRMLGTDTPVKASFDKAHGLTIEVPDSVRQNPPCQHAWTFAVSEASTESAPLKRLFHNEDCTNLFYFNQIPAGKARELIDHYVDVMAQAGVTTFLCNTNARRTNYRSRVWESFWDGYDPAGADDQPFLATIPRNDVHGYRNLIANMLAVHQQGIDYPARVIQRCRHDAISPWITLRMNDRHCTETPEHPFHGSFWKKNPQLCRKNCPGSYALCLDYAHQEVRDYYRALVVETLDRYDIDGLELDFMREPYLFSAGKEAEGAPILTGWIREVRKLVDATAAKRGHPIRLGVRVPSRPETALGMGLDAVAWAKEGLIDLLVVTPRWATLEFDMPLGHWRQLLGSSSVTLAGGLEILCRPAGEPPVVATPELATGAAVSVLSEGADAVYLFNYFQDACPGWPLPVYQKTLKAMTSLDSLLKQPRCVAITYRDVTAPGEDYRPLLPATGKEMTFPLKLGPMPDKGWRCELRIGVTPRPTAPAPTVLVNGQPCKAIKEWTTVDGLRWISFVVPMTALKDSGAQVVTVVSADQKELTVRQVQMGLRPADAATACAR
jgi:alpha-L-fucosidase